MASEQRSRAVPERSSKAAGSAGSPIAYDEGRASSTTNGPGPFAGRGPRGFHRADQRIFQSVCQLLEDHPDLDAREIEVGVESGEVTLSGSVRDERSAQIAENCARTVPGVLGIRNRLQAGGAAAPSDERDPLDETLEETYPASDAPARNLARLGAPRRAVPDPRR
jgi:osmotically-inducible protein OsmY